MTIKVNPLGAMVNNYLMKMALPMALWFIVEYLLRNAAASNFYLNFLSVPMMVVTLVAIWWIVRRLRRQILGDVLLGIQAWSFGVQLVFYAGLIEALFIYVFNQYISPDNLVTSQQAIVQQYSDVFEQLQQVDAYKSWLPKFQETLDQLKAAPIPTAIETAITMLSNDVFYAIIFMIPMAFILRKKPHFPTGNENNEMNDINNETK